MGSGLIRGLTLHEPWAYAVAHLGKDVENRTDHALQWRFMVGNYIAIHSAVTTRVGDALASIQMIYDEGYDLPGAYDDLDQLRKWKEVKKIFDFGHIVAIARVESITAKAPRNSPWRASGGVGIWLADVVTIAPLPCKGAQGLWSIPASVLQELRIRWKEATAT